MTEFYINADLTRTGEDASLLTDLVDWYQGELGDIARQDAADEQARQTALITGVDIARNLEAARFKRSGRVETLGGLVAFLANRGSVTVRPKVEKPDH